MSKRPGPPPDEPLLLPPLDGPLSVDESVGNSKTSEPSQSKQESVPEAEAAFPLISIVFENS